MLQLEAEVSSLKWQLAEAPTDAKDARREPESPAAAAAAAEAAGGGDGESPARTAAIRARMVMLEAQVTMLQWQLAEATTEARREPESPAAADDVGGTRRRREKRKKKRGRRRSRRRETRTRRRGRDEWRRSRSLRGERRESVALAEWTIDGRSPAARVAGGVSTQTPSVGGIGGNRRSSPSPPAASDSPCESASGFVGVRVWIWPFGRAATFTRARNGTSGSQSPSPGLDRPHALSRTRPFRADDARVRFGTFHEYLCSATTAPAAPTPWREDSAASSPRKRT